MKVAKPKKRVESQVAAEPVWKKYAGASHPRRTWTPEDRADYTLALEKYHAVIEAVTETGLLWAQVPAQFDIPMRVVARIARRWHKQQQAMKRKRSILAENDWAEKITDKFKERLYEAAESPNGIPVEKYNQIKVAVSHFKGVGVYRVGDAPLVQPSVVNNTIIQNAQILMNMSPEEQEQLREQYRREALAESQGHGTGRRLGMGDEKADERCVVVAAEPHADV